MERVRPLLLSLAVMLVALPVLADSGMWGSRGVPQRFVVSGERLYAAEGGRVAVYDIADPAQIRRIDDEILDDETHDIALMGTTDLLAATVRGVERFSIAADGTLSRLGSTSETGAVSRIAASGTWAAAAAGKSLVILARSGDGLEIIRRIELAQRILAVAVVGQYLYASVERQGTFVFAPPSPTVVTSFRQSGESFARSGSTLWLSSYASGLTAIDVTTPATPVVISTTGGESYRLAGVAAAGTRVYGFEAPATIRVFDATSPAAPRLTATLNEWVDTIAASGSHLFLTGPRIGAERTRYETGRPVRAFDTTDLASPRLAGEVVDLAGPVSGVWTDGSLAYVVDPPYFRVLDVSTTAQPRELSSIELPVEAQQRVRVKNGIAVVYGRALVHIVDISEPLRPVLVGTWDAQGHPPSEVGILTDGTLVEANGHSGLHIVDYTDPANAWQVGGRKWHYYSIASGDDAIYTVQETQMLTLQVANRTEVVDQMFMPIVGEQIDIAPPNAAYPTHVVLRNVEGLRIFSLQDRFNPVLTALVPAPNSTLMGTGDGVVYVAIDGTLHRLNLTGTPSLQPTEMRVTSPMQISVAGDKIVVADRYSLRVFGPDTAPPPPPPAPPRRRRAVGK